jgi:hypothetical protein
LTADADDDRDRLNHGRAWALLRAALLRRHGHRPGDPVLDCDRVVDWFLSRHVGDLEAAERDGDHWRELPIVRIRELRDIKNDLAVIRQLERCDRFRSPEVQRWLRLRDRLP